MEIADIGSLYLDNTRLMPSAIRNAVNADGPAGAASFEELLATEQEKLEKAQGASNGETQASLSKKPLIDKTDKLYEQCEALETFLVKTLISGMRSTIQKSDFMGGGFAGDMYEDMLYDEYAKDFSKNANFGMAELAYLELTGQRGKLIAAHA
ncbi:hypothetical protein FACS189444_6080 [Spirochaetia bacterium]|nr:hypothetical protein FACS189444_6080 [Spirochaetia bacterium]